MNSNVIAGFFLSHRYLFLISEAVFYFFTADLILSSEFGGRFISVIVLSSIGISVLITRLLSAKIDLLPYRKRIILVALAKFFVFAAIIWAVFFIDDSPALPIKIFCLAIFVRAAVIFHTMLSMFLPFYINDNGYVKLTTIRAGESLVYRVAYIVAPGLIFGVTLFPWTVWAIVCATLIALSLLSLVPLLNLFSADLIKKPKKEAKTEEVKGNSFLGQEYIWMYFSRFIIALSFNGIGLALIALSKHGWSLGSEYVTPFSVLYAGSLVIYIVTLTSKNIGNKLSCGTPLQFSGLSLVAGLFLILFIYEEYLYQILALFIAGVTSAAAQVVFGAGIMKTIDRPIITQVASRIDVAFKAGNFLSLAAVGWLIDASVDVVTIVVSIGYLGAFSSFLCLILARKWPLTN